MAKEAPETIKIWVRSDARDDTMTNNIGWVGLCCLEAAVTTLKSIPGSILLSKDKNTEIKDIEDFKAIDFTNKETFGNFFDIALNKRNKQGEKLNIHFWIKVYNSWEKIVTNTAVVDKMAAKNYEILKSTFDTIDIIPVGFLKFEKPSLIIYDKQRTAFKAKLETKGHKVNFEFQNRGKIVHSDPETNSKTEVHNIVEILCERQHRNVLRQASTILSFSTRRHEKIPNSTNNKSTNTTSINRISS